VLLVTLLLEAFSARHSVFYLAALAVVVLPLSCWYRKPFARITLLFLALAMGLAASPVDLQVRPEGRARVRLLQASYGLACNSDRACYGCTVPIHPAKFAVVITY
jgi:hypothetical protein